MNEHRDNRKGTLQLKDSILSVDPAGGGSLHLAGIATDAARFR